MSKIPKIGLNEGLQTQSVPMGSKKRKGEKGAEGAMGCPKKADAVAVTNELRNSRKNTNQRKY